MTKQIAVYGRKIKPLDSCPVCDAILRGEAGDSDHPQCAGCGISFGSMHENIGRLSPIGEVCGACYRLYERCGRKAFPRLVGKAGK